ncbi:MAG: right-handed parallel beta-helix repeat-containing protein [Bryobacterales bacterium]|nr:right-handed parallel beta-helix repeat-containing protein [Bryobacterales bacterium]
MNLSTHTYLAALCLSLASITAASESGFTPIDYPDAKSTTARAINSSGDVVGSFTDSAGLNHAFLLRGGKFSEIAYPDARQTWAHGINSRGDIVGQYSNGQRVYGFLLSQGAYVTLDCPPSRSASAYAINNAGEVAGYVYPLDAGTPAQGAVWKAGVCTQSEYRPEVARRTMTMFFGINDSGVVVGHWGTDGGSSHGIVYNKGNFAETNYGAGGNVINWSINNAGHIAGRFADGYGRAHGFVLRDGRMTPFRVPDSRQTHAVGINDAGDVVGEFTDSDGKVRGYMTRVSPAAAPPPVIVVDDDGADCPGSLRTIQEAVSRATAGSTILVCAGTYRGTVNIVGADKNGVRLIATGREDDVVLQGDYSERDGFHLEDVNNVLIRGFTVRDFGRTATTATVWGVGNQINLMNSHYNTIEHNRVINGDMMGIMLVGSGHNVVQNNLAFVNNNSLATCGIHVEGAGSVGNTIRRNMTVGNKVAGIMIRGVGPGNSVTDNTVVSNGRFGIDVQNTREIWIEGNRVSYNRGFWGTSPGGQMPGLGINLVNLDQATVFDNRARSNTGTDLNSDGKGQNRIEANACDTTTLAGACQN